jgi:hypothetical protein
MAEDCQRLAVQPENHAGRRWAGQRHGNRFAPAAGRVKLIAVRPTAVETYERLTRMFADVENVQVVWDQRTRGPS